jgi:hypothetical protein
MQSTFLKQVIYGALYLALIGGFAYGVFTVVRPTATCFDNRKNQHEIGVDCGGPCASCAIKQLKPLSASLVTLVPAGEGGASLFFEVTNPNANYGAEKFSYTITLHDAAGGSQTFTHSSFVYASEIRTIAEISVSAEMPVSAEVMLADPTWQKKELFEKPGLETREITFTADAATDTVRIDGLLVNRDGLLIARAGINAIAYVGGLPAGISRTIVTDLQPFEERAFSIFLPGLAQAKLTASDVRLLTDGIR